MDDGLGLLILIGVLAILFLGPMVRRMGSPIPADDIAAIRRFLETRGQTLVSLRKRVVGGPWDRENRRPLQRGRPYEVRAQGADGGRQIHRLAADGRDATGAVTLRRWEGGDWVAVLLAILALAAAPLPGASAHAADLWLTLPSPTPLPAARVSGHVTHDGASISYAVYGAGSPVVLLHGGLANSDYWGDQLPALVASGHRVILIDSRGHGRSSRDDRPYAYGLMASDVVAVMDALKVRRAAVVGWSDGAIIGLVMALKDPGRLTRVFAFAANMDPSGVKPDTLANPTFARFGREAAADYARLSPTPGGFGAFAQAISHMWNTQPNYTAADLARIHIPVAIVDGDHDEAIRREHTEYLARVIPGARLIILPGVSHFAMLQAPGEFNAAMLGFLGGR
jgi:pimeloyl-ACP methyl ester carboxylesterase